MPQIDLKPHDKEEINKILRNLVPEYDVWAFGSRVNGSAKTYSDLDLAIITKEPMSLSQKADLEDAFDQSDLTIKVDIVDWAVTMENFRRIIKENKVLIQAGH